MQNKILFYLKLKPKNIFLHDVKISEYLSLGNRYYDKVVFTISCVIVMI